MIKNLKEKNIFSLNTLEKLKVTNMSKLDTVQVLVSILVNL